MVIKSTDIDIRPVKPKWIDNSLEYALTSWTAHYNRMGKASPYSRMEKIVLGKIAEHAVFEMLEDRSIQFDLQGQTKWYQIDQYDLAIQNHTIDIKSNFIDLSIDYFKKRRPSTLEERLRWILKFESLVPADQLASSRKNLKSKSKLFIFCFIEGRFGINEKGVAVHAFWDYRWLKKGEQKESPPVGQVEIKYNGSNSGYITLYGTSKKNEAIKEKIKLVKSIKSKNAFFQLFSIKYESGVPDGCLEIFSKNLRLKEVIYPKISFAINKVDGVSVIETNDWSQIHLSEGQVFTPGFIDEEDFRVIAKFHPRYTKSIEQYRDTLADNYGCNVTDLATLDKLQEL